MAIKNFREESLLKVNSGEWQRDWGNRLCSILCIPVSYVTYDRGSGCDSTVKAELNFTLKAGIQPLCYGCKIQCFLPKMTTVTL